jgi:DNA polymerase III delta prime subunit
MNQFFKLPNTTIQYPQTFTTKYKPYFLNDFCIDFTLKSVLHTLLEIDDLNLLILGPASSGKTSLLHAIVREYYGLSKTQSFPENNLLLINSLKEQGINYYRNEMKTFCQSRCSIYGKKKMIIVDDLDIVNQQCQQVFRNYIDKYKNNVHFISTCSNLQKVIESIQSRLHILRLEPPSQPQIENIMQTIIKHENIPISKEAQNYILTFSNYSLREVINHLEKIHILKTSSEKLVSLEECKQICSNISFQQFENYILELRQQNLVKAIQIFNHIYEYGYSVIDIFDYFFTFVKTTDLLTETERYLIIPHLCRYITYFHSIHENSIELSLFTRDIMKIFIM